MEHKEVCLGAGAWTVFILFTIRTSVGLLWTRWWTCGFHRMRGLFFFLQPLNSSRRSARMELVYSAICRSVSSSELDMRQNRCCGIAEELEAVVCVCQSAGDCSCQVACAQIFSTSNTWTLVPFGCRQLTVQHASAYSGGPGFKYWPRKPL